ncbi:MAG: hydrogenase maturation nickel metallochaperone HypA [Kiritimatiellae bacterium]|jgi:hydrogenase nickel incorporation protein HypA/HybF|nr:hydrogenase maturation nickel metallochaperone HypA [Kiritimatiellia bacterium]
MHEFSICQSLVAAVLGELKKNTNGRARLTKARVRAGAYHRLVPASLKSAYKILTKNTPAEGSSLLIKTVPVKLKCARCGWRGAAGGLMFACRKCGGVDLEIAAGRELYLESIEVE